MSKDIILKDLGVISYQNAWDIQTELFRELIDRKMKNREVSSDEKEVPFHYFLFAEHSHVYTLGRNGDEQNLLLSEEELETKNATFFKINRGGDITYHGFGQVVGYPIIDLDEFFTDIGKYVRFLEEMAIRTLAEYEVVGERIKGMSGVWIDANLPTARKICAVGVHLSRWTTMHGFAFNINTDLSYFDAIVPCGINDKGVTSLQKELGYSVDLATIKKQLIKHFLDLFEAKLKEE